MRHAKTPGMLLMVAACLLAAAAVPAAGSEVYDTGDPYDGQEISQSPSRVMIRFTEPVWMQKAILVDEADRTFDVRFGTPEDEAADSALVRVPGALPPGKYRLHWIVYVPGHRHSDDGTVRFTVLPPRPAAPVPATQ